jgi:hypothetical protein
MNEVPIFRDSQGKPMIRGLRSGKLRQAQRRAALWTLLILFSAVGAMAAATQLNLATQVQGILATGNGGTGTASTLTGLVRGGSPMTASELSGDCSTSGSNSVTCAKVNGTSVPTNSSADQVLGTNASATGAWMSIPNCTGALQYSTSTHTFSCGSALTGNFSDAEVPSGSINGSNVTFTLAHTPNPAASLDCFENGLEQRASGADFTLATATMTYGTAPPTGSTLVCYYRY